jgi:hypothetical protein
VAIIRKRGEYLGTVEAVDKEAAEAAAVKAFDLTDEQRKRLVVQEQRVKAVACSVLLAGLGLRRALCDYHSLDCLGEIAVEIGRPLHSPRTFAQIAVVVAAGEFQTAPLDIVSIPQDRHHASRRRWASIEKIGRGFVRDLASCHHGPLDLDPPGVILRNNCEDAHVDFTSTPLLGKLIL